MQKYYFAQNLPYYNITKYTALYLIEGKVLDPKLLPLETIPKSKVMQTFLTSI